MSEPWWEDPANWRNGPRRDGEVVHVRDGELVFARDEKQKRWAVVQASIVALPPRPASPLALPPSFYAPFYALKWKLVRILSDDGHAYLVEEKCAAGGDAVCAEHGVVGCPYDDCRRATE